MSSHKRKRSTSHSRASSSQPASPSPVLNPHAHSESTLKQLHVAGLPDSALLPSTYISQFPHRPIRPTHLPPHQDSSDDDDDDNNNNASPPPTSGDDDDEDATTAKARNNPTTARRASAMRTAQDTHLALLTSTIHRALALGDIARAKRAFGLVRRSDVRGKPVDLRRGGLWGLGVEVLMREERTATTTTNDKRRWGATANMPAVRAYLEALVRLYPYNRLHPRAVSDLDFYPVLFGCEVYDAWAEQRIALERLNGDDNDGYDEGEAWAGDVDMADEHGEGEDDALRHFSARERRVRQAKMELASRTLEAMRAVAMRMEGLLVDVPYSRSADMWRLRGMVALYMGDLSVPPPPRTDVEEERGLRVRDEERERARRFFRKMRENGGRVDAFTQKWLGGGDNDGSEADADSDQDMGGSAFRELPLFSSYHHHSLP